jgi:addiction module HigA family antidote
VDGAEDVQSIPSWKAHQLTGDRKGTWSLTVTRPALSALLNTRAALSPEMALRIEKAFGVKMDTLLRMQTAFEIAEARSRERDIKVDRYAPKAPPTGRQARLS